MLSCQKHLFSLEPEFHYINGAYMSPLMKSVEIAGYEGIRKKARPYRLSQTDFFTETQILRGVFAEIVHAEMPQRVALIPSASYGLSIVANNLDVKKGQNIIVAEAQFPSNIYPWRILAQKMGLDIRTVAYPNNQKGRGEEWNRRILESIDADTALVALSHVHWANGTLFDLKSIADRVHESGGFLVIDGTQSVGALPIDVQAMGIDALICAGYKWLMGPYSLGYAYFNERFDGGKPIEENWINRKNSEDFANLIHYQNEYQPHSLRYDVGERSNFILVPMGIAALKQIQEWGVSNIQNYCLELTKQAVGLWQSKGFWIEESNWRSQHLFGVQLPKGVSVELLQRKLKEKNISVSVRGDFVRISPHVYNDEKDINALTDVFLNL